MLASNVWAEDDVMLSQATSAASAWRTLCDVRHWDMQFGVWRTGACCGSESWQSAADGPRTLSPHPKPAYPAPMPAAAAVAHTPAVAAMLMTLLVALPWVASPPGQGLGKPSPGLRWPSQAPRSATSAPSQGGVSA